MTSLLTRPRFLAAAQQRVVLDALDDPDLRWQPGADLGRTSAGRSLQLATSAEHAKPPMRRMAGLLASQVYDTLTDSGITLPPAPELTPQVFPVKMHGSPDNPPHQHPHRDRSSLGHPRLTCIYYPLVESTQGGALVLHTPEGTPDTRHQPIANLLVVIPGDTLHSVEPLTSGRRVTIVTNLYW